MRKDEESVIVMHSLTPDILKTKKIKLRSEATSLFDVQRWMFDVRRFFQVNPARHKCKLTDFLTNLEFN